MRPIKLALLIIFAIGMVGLATAQAEAACTCPAGQAVSGTECILSVFPYTDQGPAFCSSSSSSSSSYSKAILTRATVMAVPDSAIDPANIATGGIFSGNPVSPGGSSVSHLGMYVTPPSGSGSGVTFGAGGYSLRNTGYGITDSAGIVAPGTVTPGFRENGGSGGISGSYDASYFVGNNQKLIFSGLYDYTSSTANFGTSAALIGLGIPNGGSVSNNISEFGGSVLYTNNTFYVLGKAGYEIGRGTESQGIAAGGGSGSYGIDGYNADVSVGNVFMLVDTTRPVYTPMYTKTTPYTKAPAPVADGGYAIGLDLSGHIGYQNVTDKGFTDSVGFLFGNEQINFGDAGLKAKLIASVPRNGVTWLPYIAVTGDWQFAFSHTSFLPNQVALPGGDLVSFSQGLSTWGTQLGIDARMQNGWTVGVNGFYSQSSDTSVVGGRAFLRIPFGPTTVVARY